MTTLPYAGTSGWSGSQTSEDRATQADSSGLTGKRQQATIVALEAAGSQGLTWNELGAALNLHHGAASGVLSNLHKVGSVARLDQVRNKSKVYVLPQYVGDRVTEPPVGYRNRLLLTRAITALGVALPILGCPIHEEFSATCPRCDLAAEVSTILRIHGRNNP